MAQEFSDEEEPALVSDALVAFLLDDVGEWEPFKWDAGDESCESFRSIEHEIAAGSEGWEAVARESLRQMKLQQAEAKAEHAERAPRALRS